VAPIQGRGPIQEGITASTALSAPLAGRDGGAGLFTLPPEMDVRPLSAPFGIEGDIDVIKGIEKATTKNMMKKQRGLLGVLVVPFIMIAFLMVVMRLLSGGEGLYKLPWFGPLLLNLTFISLMVIFLVHNIWYFSPIARLKRYESFYKGPEKLKEQQQRVEEWRRAQGLNEDAIQQYTLLFGRNPEENLYVAPMEREAFPWHAFRKWLKGIQYTSVLGIPIALMLAYLVRGDILVYIKALVVLPLTFFTGLSMGPAFRHRIAVHMSASGWYKIRSSMALIITLAMFIGFLVFMRLLLMTESLDGIVGDMRADPLLSLLLVIPRAFSDLILDPRVDPVSLTLAVMFWALGAWAYHRLRTIDFPITNQRLIEMGYYRPTWPWSKDKKVEGRLPSPVKAKGPRPAKAPVKAAASVQAPAQATDEVDKRTETKKPTRSQRLSWESVDVGEGAGALVTKNLLTGYRFDPKKINIIVGILFFISIMILLAGNGPGGSDADLFSVVMMMPFAPMILTVVFLVNLPSITEIGKEDILRLLPIESKAMMWAYLKQPISYGLGLYYGVMVPPLLIFRMFDPLILVGLLMLLPFIGIAVLPLTTLNIFFKRAQITMDQVPFGLYLLFIIVLAIYTLMPLSLLHPPIWASLAILSLVIPISIPAVLRIGANSIHRRYMKGHQWRRRRALKTALVGALLLLPLVASPLIILSTDAYIIPGPQPMVVDHTVDGEEGLVNGSFVFDGSLIVPAGTRLSIVNSTVEFKVVQEGETGLYVNQAGWLYIFNSTITAKGYFVLEIHGSARIYNSTIRKTYGDDFSYTGGLSIYSDSVFVENTLVEDGLVHGIYIYESAPYIKNCTIRKNKVDGIRARYSMATIEYNTIEENGDDGMDLEYGSNANVMNNMVLNNSDDGIVSEDSTPRVENNLIADNGNIGVRTIDTGGPELWNNTMVNNKNGPLKIGEDEGPFSPGGELFFLMVPMFMIIGTLFVAMFLRKPVMR
jgi:parallel beta-helix repeat protein